MEVASLWPSRRRMSVKWLLLARESWLPVFASVLLDASNTQAAEARV